MRAVSKVIDTFLMDTIKWRLSLADLLRPIYVLKLFSEDPDAPLRSKHFATEQEARAWLDQKWLE